MNLGPVLVDVATKDLKDAALDWVVGVIEGATPLADGRLRWLVGGHEVDYTPGQVNNPYMLQHRGYGYCPSIEWRQGGPLLDKYQLDFSFERIGVIHASPCKDDGQPVIAVRCEVNGQFGETHLIAACRAIVAVKLGDIVKVPALLVLP